MSVVACGRLVRWSDEKGFGFIENQTSGDVFLHVKALSGHQKRPEVGDEVRYRLVKDDKGRAVAADVKLLGQPLIVISLFTFATIIIVFIFYGWLAYLAITNEVLRYLPAPYFILSVIAWFVYAVDKKKAQTGQWRTPERTLQFLAMLGGWPGAWLAQRILRHKSRKISFQLLFGLMVILNLAALTYFLDYCGALPIWAQIHIMKLKYFIYQLGVL